MPQRRHTEIYREKRQLVISEQTNDTTLDKGSATELTWNKYRGETRALMSTQQIWYSRQAIINPRRRIYYGCYIDNGGVKCNAWCEYVHMTVQRTEQNGIDVTTVFPVLCQWRHRQCSSYNAWLCTQVQCDSVQFRWMSHWTAVAEFLLLLVCITAGGRERCVVLLSPIAPSLDTFQLQGLTLLQHRGNYLRICQPATRW